MAGPFFGWLFRFLEYGLMYLAGIVATSNPWLSAIPALLAFVVKGIKELGFNRFDKRMLKEYISNFYRDLQFNESDQVRCRIYVKSLRGGWIPLVWVGDTVKPSLKRQSNQVGIIGQCAREKKPFVEIVDLEAYKVPDYTSYLVRRWVSVKVWPVECPLILRLFLRIH